MRSANWWSGWLERILVGTTGSWGARSNLGQKLSDHTVGNILRRHGIPPAPKWSANTTWKDFIAAHMTVSAGANFFTVEVLTWRGLITNYVLFFLHVETRRVSLAGINLDSTEEWMTQMGRNAIDEMSGVSGPNRYVLARPRCEVLRGIPRDAGRRKCEVPAIACE